ncbi:MAG: hypothetical protein KDJ29_03810 [Hyphomicrobiales bacterium]|nr:hypothetical protein [Hyphomicrobiales bacterium]
MRAKKMPGKLKIDQHGGEAVGWFAMLCLTVSTFRPRVAGAGTAAVLFFSFGKYLGWL